MFVLELLLQKKKKKEIEDAITQQTKHILLVLVINPFVKFYLN